MTGHPDADVLARFREDLLGRRRSARIRAHLARCERCAALEQGLGEVSTLLAAAPVPPMPDELAARLDRVLATEAAARAGAQAPGAAARAGTQAPGAAARAGTQAADEASPGPSPLPDRSGRPARRWRAPRWRTPALRAAAAAAAAALIAGGGYGVSRLVLQGGGTSGTASSGSAALPRTQAPLAQHAASGASVPAAKNPANGTPTYPAAGSVQVVRSGTDYLPGRLSAQTEAVLARRSSGFTTQSPASPASLATALRGCVQLVTGGAQPLLVDLARYQGRPATIIVQAPAGGQPGQVWVVGTGCSAHSRDVLAHALLTGSG